LDGLKRRLLKLALFLLLGAIINVAVAWGCAWQCGTRGVGQPSPARLASPAVQAWEAHTADLVESASQSGQFLYAEDLDALGVRRRVSHESLISGGAFHALREETAFFISTDAGWPCYCLRGYQLLKTDMAWSPSNWNCSNGIEVPSRVVNGEVLVHPVLPTVIRPLSFMCNTILYAAMFWALFGGPFALRRHSRVRRNLCPHCAYPVGTNDVCTECGKAVKAKRVEVSA
jgi:hypothetical protein